MRRSFYYAVLTTAAVLVFGGCWGRKFFHMPSETINTSRKVDSLLAENLHLKEQMRSIERRLKEQEDFSRGTRAQLKLDLESIKDEINSLKEIVREQSTSGTFRRPRPVPLPVADSTAKKTSLGDSTLAARSEGEAGTGITDSRSLKPDTGSVGEPSQVRAETPSEGMVQPTRDTTGAGSSKTFPPPPQLYRQAYLYFNRGDYDLALEELKILIDHYGDDPICEDALFLKGESFFQKKSFFDAINQFSTLLTRFPKGKRVPGALLRMALAYENVGERDLATGIAKRLIKEHPYSEEAAVVKEHFTGLE